MLSYSGSKTFTSDEFGCILVICILMDNSFIPYVVGLL
jgi:hypothetical protein